MSLIKMTSKDNWFFPLYNNEKDFEIKRGSIGITQLLLHSKALLPGPLSLWFFLEHEFSKYVMSISASLLFLIKNVAFQTTSQPVELESPEVWP